MNKKATKIVAIIIVVAMIAAPVISMVTAMIQ
jgi:hypothetical protein